MKVRRCKNANAQEWERKLAPNRAFLNPEPRPLNPRSQPVNPKSSGRAPYRPSGTDTPSRNQPAHHQRWAVPTLRIRTSSPSHVRTSTHRACAELLALIAILLGLAASVLYLRAIAIPAAEKQVQTLIDEIHANDEPILIEDYKDTWGTIPDEKNAAYYIDRAVAAMCVPDDVTVDFETVWDDPKLVAAHDDDVQRLLNANQEVLQLLRKCRLCIGAEWGVRYKSPMFEQLVPHALPSTPRLGKLLCTFALYHHVHGDDSQAVERLIDMRQIAEALCWARNGPVSHLTGVAVDVRTCFIVSIIAGDLRVPPRGKPPTSGEASRDQIESLIAGFEDESALRWSYRESFLWERTSAHDQYDFLLNSSKGPATFEGAFHTSPFVLWLIKPFLIADNAFAITYHTKFVESAYETTYQGACRHIDYFPEPESRLARWARLVSTAMTPSLVRAVPLHYRALANRRMAAIALAIRLYELDHGQRPESLDQLVPDYFDKLPPDPILTAETPFGYLPHDEQPRLYSIGTDGVDDHGEQAFRENGRVNEDEKDLVFFLGQPTGRPEDKREQP